MNLLAIYHRNSKADRYLFGFENKHEKYIYSVALEPRQIDIFIVDDKYIEQEGGPCFPSLRYKIQRGQRDKLEAGLLPDFTPIKTRRICSTDELEKLAKTRNINRGQAFEIIACERLGLKRNENTTEAWFNGPDAWDMDGTALQIGFEGKTFTYTAQVERNGLSE